MSWWCDVGSVVVAGMMVTGWVWSYGGMEVGVGGSERATCVYRGLYRQVYCAVQSAVQSSTVDSVQVCARLLPRPAPSVSRIKSPSPDTSLAPHFLKTNSELTASVSSQPAIRTVLSGRTRLQLCRANLVLLVMIRGQGRAGPQ